MWWWDVGQGEAFYSPVIRSQSECAHASGLWTSPVFLIFFVPLRWDRLARVGRSWVFPCPQASYALLPSFPWRQALLGRTFFQDGSFPAPFLRNARAFFFHIDSGNLVELLEVNLTVCHTATPHSHRLDRVPWGLYLSVVPLNLRQVVTSQVSYPGAASGSSSTPDSALASQDSLFVLSFSPVSGQWLALCPHLSNKSKTRRWHFSLFSSSLVRTMWWLPRSLHSEPETGSL